MSSDANLMQKRFDSCLYLMAVRPSYLTLANSVFFVIVMMLVWLLIVFRLALFQWVPCVGPSQGHGGTESRVPRVTYVKWLRGRTIPRSRCRLRSQSRAVFLHTLVCCAYRSNLIGRLQESIKPGFLHVSGYFNHVFQFRAYIFVWVVTPCTR